MGNIKSVLLNEQVSTPLFNNRFTVELCENVHLHYRNLRLEFPKEEFLGILRQLKQIDEKTIEDFQFEKSAFLSLVEEVLPDQSEFDKRLQIEEQQEGHYHVHYRNMRVELWDLMDLGYGLFEVPLKVDMDWVNWVGRTGEKIKGFGIKKVRLSQLKAGVYRENDDPGWVPLEESPMMAYLRGDQEQYVKYLELLDKLADKNDPPNGSIEKFEALKKSIETRGYGETLIVIHEGNLIADGQHRAAILYHLYGDMDVRVAEVFF